MYVIYDDYSLLKLMTYHIEAPDIRPPPLSPGISTVTVGQYNGLYIGLDKGVSSRFQFRGRIVSLTCEDRTSRMDHRLLPMDCRLNWT